MTAPVVLSLLQPMPPVERAPLRIAPSQCLGLYTVRGKIMDKDNGGNEYTVLVLAKNVTGILDNFNRANGGIGSNWKGSTGTNIYRIASNRVDVRGNGPIYWRNAFGVDQEASVVLTTVDVAGMEQDLLLKVQGDVIAQLGYRRHRSNL